MTEIYKHTFDTKLGKYSLILSNKGLVQSCFDVDYALPEGLSLSLAPKRVEDMASMTEAWLQAYADGDFSNHPLPPLDLQGTEFQKRIWQVLLSIPTKTTCTYKDIAITIQNPKAFRAVGSAVGANPLAIIIPCHRVLAANRKIGGFRWGTPRKQILLDQEGISYTNSKNPMSSKQFLAPTVLVAA